MKTRFLIISILMAFICQPSSAKPKKIKYGDIAVYEGEAQKKSPEGPGRLVISNQEYIKNAPIYSDVIEGEFADNHVPNAHVTFSSGWTFDGAVTFYYTLEQKKPLVESVRYVLSGGSITHDNDRFTIAEGDSISIVRTITATNKNEADFQASFTPHIFTVTQQEFQSSTTDVDQFVGATDFTVTASILFSESEPTNWTHSLSPENNTFTLNYSNGANATYAKPDDWSATDLEQNELHVTPTQVRFAKGSSMIGIDLSNSSTASVIMLNGSSISGSETIMKLLSGEYSGLSSTVNGLKEWAKLPNDSCYTTIRDLGKTFTLNYQNVSCVYKIPAVQFESLKGHITTNSPNISRLKTALKNIIDWAHADSAGIYVNYENGKYRELSVGFDECVINFTENESNIIYNDGSVYTGTFLFNEITLAQMPSLTRIVSYFKASSINEYLLTYLDGSLILPDGTVEQWCDKTNQHMKDLRADNISAAANNLVALTVEQIKMARNEWNQAKPQLIEEFGKPLVENFFKGRVTMGMPENFIYRLRQLNLPLIQIIGPYNTSGTGICYAVKVPNLETGEIALEEWLIFDTLFHRLKKISKAPF